MRGQNLASFRGKDKLGDYQALRCSKLNLLCTMNVILQENYREKRSPVVSSQIEKEEEPHTCPRAQET